MEYKEGEIVGVCHCCSIVDLNNKRVVIKTPEGYKCGMGKDECSVIQVYNKLNQLEQAMNANKPEDLRKIKT